MKLPPNYTTWFQIYTDIYKNRLSDAEEVLVGTGEKRNGKHVVWRMNMTEIKLKAFDELSLQKLKAHGIHTNRTQKKEVNETQST